MKIMIDRDGCIECGVCMGECPHIFELMPHEKARVVEQFRTNGSMNMGQVGNDLVGCAHKAADSCPVQVIKLS